MNNTLETRVEKLEQELAMLKFRLSRNANEPWWQKISGAFENDPDFDKMIALGRQIRKQDRLDTES